MLYACSSLPGAEVDVEVELAVGIAAALTAAAYAEQREGFGDFFAGEDGDF